MYFLRLNHKIQTSGPRSYSHSDPLVISTISDPDFPFLISFPRTGSHWLRSMMEIYLGIPSLTRIFFYQHKNVYSCYHTHDLINNDKLGDLYRKNVIYLYRDPVDTIYSQMRYYGEDLEDGSRLNFWTDLYGSHLYKWLIDEGKSVKKIIIRYEDLKTDSEKVFRMLSEFFDIKFSRRRLEFAESQVSKYNIKNLTGDNERIINLENNYEQRRKNFKEKSKHLITNTLTRGRDGLEEFFAEAR